MQLDRVIAGDCLDVLPVLPAGSVDLVVTSPPYPGQRQDGRTVLDWLAWMDRVLDQLACVLKPAGVLALNVMFRREGGWFDERLFTGVPALLDRNGFGIVDVYIWHKPNPVPAGNLDRHDIPAWEPVFVASRSHNYVFYPVRGDYSPKTAEKAAAGNMRGNGVGHDYTAGGHHELHPDGARQGNVLAISSSGDQGRPRAEGGSFPRALPARFIEQHTRQGDVVLDPFCGAGTTCREAQIRGRRWLGIELVPAEVAKARRWLARPYAVPLLN